MSSLHYVASFTYTIISSKICVGCVHWHFVDRWQFLIIYIKVMTKSSILYQWNYNIQARFWININCATLQKIKTNHIVCKLYTTNLRSWKRETTFYRQKHLSGMKVFRLIFYIVSKNQMCIHWGSCKVKAIYVHIKRINV